MTKLYHNGELEGWQVPGQQDRKADRIDVPSAPAELAAWLNHRRVGPTGAAAEWERVDAQLASEPEPPAPRPPAPAIKPPAIGASADELVDWLFDHASNSQIHDVMGAIADRFAQAIKHTREKGQ